jgi:hypothetical protein
MKRLLHVIESDEGYLCDTEKYTEDPNAAITFVDFTVAAKRLAAMDTKIKADCWVGSVYVDFPHPKGYSSLIQTNYLNKR